MNQHNILRPNVCPIVLLREVRFLERALIWERNYISLFCLLYEPVPKSYVAGEKLITRVDRRKLLLQLGWKLVDVVDDGA